MARRIRKGRVITAAALTIALATTGIISLKRNTDNSPNSYATANETNEVKMTTTAPSIVETVITEESQAKKFIRNRNDSVLERNE